MASVVTWLLGRDVQLIQVTGCTIDPVAGTITLGTAQVLLNNTAQSPPPAVCEELQITYSPETENIVAVGRPFGNKVITEKATRVVVHEILSKTVGTVLASIATAYDYVQVVAQRNGKTWTYYGTVEEYDEPLHRGKQVGRMSLGMADINAPNPTYA